MTRSIQPLAFIFGLGLLLTASSAPATVVMDWVTVGNPGNLADSTTYGRVDTTYRIGKYEVTNDQYAEFLSAVADTDANGLYNAAMNSDARGGITRSGASGSFTYAVKPGQGSNPVVFVSFHDALRFANWLHNSQPTGAQDNSTTEDGAYTITLAGINANSITRNGGANFFIPSENEWYKAAYHDKMAGTAGTYFDYPTGANTVPYSDNPGSLNTPDNTNAGNFYKQDNPAPNGYNGGYAVTGSTSFVSTTNYLTNVGAYALAASPYGTFDQAGNVWEWEETIVSGSNRVLRGGSWSDITFLASTLAASRRDSDNPAHESYSLGFRVASVASSSSEVVPEPSSVVLGGIGAVVLTLLCRRQFQKTSL